MPIIFERHPKITAFFAGALSALAFAPHYYIFLAFLSFSTLLYLLIKAPTAKRAFSVGYCFGFAHFACGFSWVGNALLIDIARFGWLYPIVLLASGTFFGFFFAIPATMTFISKKTWQKWLIFSSGTILFEWIRSFFLTGFPWNLLGYSLAFNQELIQAASLGGTYLLSFAALSGYGIFGLWLAAPSKRRFFEVCLWILICFGSLWTFGYQRIKNAIREQTQTIVRLVQPSIPQKLKWSQDTAENNFQEYLTLSSKDTGRTPNIIIWGETASPFRLEADEFHRLEIAKILAKGSYLITGTITYQPLDNRLLPHNSIAVITSDGAIAGLYHKSHLVPFGEYIPGRKYLPEFIRPVANAIGTFGKGSGPQTLRFQNIPSFGGIICYEVIFPHEVANINNRPEFLINLTNDGWYGESAGPYQHWIAAKLRAVEEGLPLVRSANNGISGIITPYGDELQILKLNQKGISEGVLPRAITPTLYSRYGNWITISFCLILLFLGIIKVVKCKN